MSKQRFKVPLIMGMGVDYGGEGLVPSDCTSLQICQLALPGTQRTRNLNIIAILNSQEAQNHFCP